ncbi:MAG TPA: hypothetical protein VHH54_06300, partial [Actinomycetota bacterium]|nr:hypothetical protein [Actinomycetota bacterium]
GEETSEDEPSPGGTFRRGRLTLINVDTGFLQQRDVFGEVEKGWVPPHETWEEFQLLGKPQFTSEREVVLTPQFGKPHAFAVPH